MILTLVEAKSYLRVDFADDDALIQLLIDSAEAYLKNATGKTFDDKNSIAKIVCLILVVDGYENRNPAETSKRAEQAISGYIDQLKYCREEAGT